MAIQRISIDIDITHTLDERGANLLLPGSHLHWESIQGSKGLLFKTVLTCFNQFYDIPQSHSHCLKHLRFYTFLVSQILEVLALESTHSSVVIRPLFAHDHFASFRYWRNLKKMHVNIVKAPIVSRKFSACLRVSRQVSCETQPLRLQLQPGWAGTPRGNLNRLIDAQSTQGCALHRPQTWPLALPPVQTAAKMHVKIQWIIIVKRCENMWK